MPGNFSAENTTWQRCWWSFSVCLFLLLNWWVKIAPLLNLLNLTMVPGALGLFSLCQRDRGVNVNTPSWLRANPCQFFHFQPSRMGGSFGPFSLNIQQVVYGFGGTSWGPVFLTNTCCHPSFFQLIHFSHCVWWRGVKRWSAPLGVCTVVENIKANSPLTILSAGEIGGAAALERKSSRTATSQLSQCLAPGGRTVGDSWVYVSLVGKGKLVKEHFYAL